MKTFRKPLFIITFLAVLLWGWFFGVAQAQYYDQNISQSEPIGNIYMISNPLQQVFLLLQRIIPLLQTSLLQHAAAPEDIFINIPRETIVNLLDESDDFDQFSHKMRILLIQSLMDTQYPNFVNQPYREEGNFAIVEQSWDFKVLKNITTKDMLDTLLTNKLTLFRWDFTQIKKLNKHLKFSAINITVGEYDALWSIFLFRNEQDLRDLWYELVSRKSRINTDPDYRRRNIMAAFHNIGNVRLVMPGETFSTLRELHYNPGMWEFMYMSGYAILWAGVKLVYGGWLCGVATALFQGSLTNLWLSRIQYRPHSIYYRNLYEAEINGITITEPWLDATIFSPVIDLKLQNILDYPIILVFAFDGKSWSPEQVFTIAKEQDKWTFEYIGTYKKGWAKCFTRKVNGTNMTNCYSKIKNF